MFLSGHPLAEWSALLETYTDGSLTEILERPDKTVVTAGGIVAAVKAISTKTGNRMAFVTLEDIEGAVEVVVFAELYSRAQALLQSEAPIVVRGTLERTEDSGKILAEEIYSLSEAPEKLTESIHIHINAALHTRSDLEALRQLLSAPENRGGRRAFSTSSSPIEPRRSSGSVGSPSAGDR